MTLSMERAGFEQIDAVYGAHVRVRVQKSRFSRQAGGCSFCSRGQSGDCVWEMRGWLKRKKEGLRAGKLGVVCNCRELWLVD